MKEYKVFIHRVIKSYYSTSQNFGFIRAIIANPLVWFSAVISLYIYTQSLLTKKEPSKLALRRSLGAKDIL